MSVIDISSKLGEYMLKGWILTDETCSRDGCSVSLLRSPRGQSPTTSFCVNCDTHPIFVKNFNRGSTSSSIASSSPMKYISDNSPSTISVNAVYLTDNQGLHRRQQSDAASAEIGRLLLRGWAMLADECPNADCHGVPLMRPPATGKQNDTRKECVVCRTTYVDEKYLMELQKKTNESSPLESCSSDVLQTADNLHSNNTAKIINDNNDQKRGKQKSPHPLATLEENDFLSSSHPTGILDSMQTSVELALTNLSKRLVTATADTNIVDSISIGQNVDSIGKLVKILEDINRLQRTSTSGSS